MKTPSSTQKKMIAGGSVLLLLMVVLLLNHKNSAKKGEEIAQIPAESTEVVGTEDQVDNDVADATQESQSKTAGKVASAEKTGSAETSPSSESRTPASQDTNEVSGAATGVAVTGAVVSGTSAPATAGAPAAAGAVVTQAPKTGLSWFQKLFGGSGKSAGTTTGAVTGTAPSIPSAGLSTGVNPGAEVTKIDNTPDPGCREVVYTQKSGSKFKNRNHKNFLKLEDEAINFKSVCVRVDGVPVRYDQVKEKGKSEVTGFMLGAIAGPESRIVVKYCVGKNTCHDDCAIPKDEFMDAIGGYDAEEDTKVKVVRWDPNDAEADRDVTAEIGNEIKRELAEIDMVVSKDWTAKTEKLSCQVLTARKNAPKTGRSVASVKTAQE